MKKNRILKISILVLSIVAIFLVIGITYAYFGMNRQENEDNILASSCFNLELTANNILSEGNIPMTDEDAKTLTPYSFTIKNTCGTPAEVGINLDILKTTNATLSNYKVSLSNSVSLAPTLINDLESDEIANDDTLLTKKLTSVYIAGKNEKIIELRLWMKDSVGVGEGENEIIESKISLTATAVSVQYNPVQEKIIADNGGIFKVRGKKDINLKEIYPSIKYISEKEIMEDEILVPEMKYMYADSYEFNEKGFYTLISPKSEYLNDNMIDKYICDNGKKECQTMYKITSYTLHEGDAFEYDNYEESGYSFGIKDSFIVGKGYKVDYENWEFTLTDPVEAKDVKESLIGYYFLDSYEEVGWALYQIKEIEMAENQEEPYFEKITENNALYLTSNKNRTVGKSFRLDKEKGIYVLEDVQNSITFSEEYIDYYYCNSDPCKVLYQIKEVDGSILKKATYRNIIKNENKITLNDAWYIIDYNYDLISGEKYTLEESDYYRNDSPLYLGEDDFGDSYYFRGGNDSNNIYFAGYYWNIVRINGDGSLRLIYRGTTPTASATDTQIGTSGYGSTGYNAYVGYMYGTANSQSYVAEHANKMNSWIKSRLDTWYENNLLSSNEYIADSIFCNDRSKSSGSGYGTSNTYYNGYYRKNSSNNMMPDLKCSQKNDRFTVSNTYGNQTLKYPIGLLTTDEAGYAGLYSRSTSTYNYLNTGIDYWTMTPNHFSSSAYVNYITSTGAIGEKVANSTIGIRPVINLKGNVILSGTGTLEDPYRVEGLKTE